MKATLFAVGCMPLLDALTPLNLLSANISEVLLADIFIYLDLT